MRRPNNATRAPYCLRSVVGDLQKLGPARAGNAGEHAGDAVVYKITDRAIDPSVDVRVEHLDEVAEALGCGFLSELAKRARRMRRIRAAADVPDVGCVVGSNCRGDGGVAEQLSIASEVVHRRYRRQQNVDVGLLDHRGHLVTPCLRVDALTDRWPQPPAHVGVGGVADDEFGSGGFGGQRGELRVESLHWAKTTSVGRMRFEDKVVLITGGTTGIGLDAARRLASEGAAVVVTGRRAEPGAEAVAEIEAAGGRALFVQGDVAKAADAERMVVETLSAFGRLDVAVNNAGIGGQMVPMHEMDEDYFDSVVDVNLKGVWLSMKYEVPPMLAQGGGSIINISSVAGVKGGPVAGAAYVAAKHGVVGLTREGAAEYAAEQIRVNCICPAAVETPLAAVSFADPELRATVEAKHPIGRIGVPADVAAAIAYLGSDEAAFVTGTILPIDGGFLL